MKEKQYISSQLNYLKASPTPFHAVAAALRLLEDSGFIRLFEKTPWSSLAKGKYFVTRNDSSLIAFTWDETCTGKLHIAGAHLDSPGLKIKPRPVREKHHCLQLGVEVYGGALLAPWFDRDLSIAGRVCCHQDNDTLHTPLIDFKRAIGIIPSLAIHFDREANKGRKINKQTDLVPVIGLTDNFSGGFYALLKDQLLKEHPEYADAEILDFDLFLYDVTPPLLTGLHEELLTGSRLDNLLSCHACLQGLISTGQQANSLIILNDHEEVGSLSTTGAQGSFLEDILSRLYKNPIERQQVLRKSLFISADNAHAVHPNFDDKHDPQHLPVLNGGPVIKYNANQRYATNARTAAQFRMFCHLAEVPVQEFVMRSDMACGSTIGPMTSAALGIDTVDVGIPTLAMHSIRETAAKSDCWFLFRALQKFFSAEKNA